MTKISVLMSVFNESEEEIRQSIESILDQTIISLEFIIVNDNPARSDLIAILKRYEEEDKRIVVIKNDRNIGLAMSLNKAAKVSNSPYLARMDADDISEPVRLLKQYNTIHNSQFDLVCSSYNFIDEHSEYIERELESYTPEDIKNGLPLDNLIHHPTVVIKREMFEKVGGYRNFSSAQDYDLWLRMLYVGGKFYMSEDKLIKYRIRENSISYSKRAQQTCTMTYIRQLYKLRLKTGKDNYSYDNYLKYISKNDCLDNKKNINVNIYFNLLVNAQEFYRKKRYFKYLILKIRVFFKCNILRKEYIEKTKMKFFLKYMDKNK